MMRALLVLPFIPFVNRFFIVVFFVYICKTLPLSKASEIMKSLLIAIVFVIPIVTIWVILIKTMLLEDSTVKTVVGHVITYIFFLCFDQGLLYRIKRRRLKGGQ